MTVRARPIVSAFIAYLAVLGTSGVVHADLVAVSFDAEGGAELVGLGETEPGTNIGSFRFTTGINNCSFDGAATTCSVSGTYTETAASTNLPGATGTFIFTQSYQGDGPSPLIVENIEPFGEIIRFVETQGTTFTLNVRGDGGLVLNLIGGFGFSAAADPSSASCTGLESTTPCTIGQVGLVPGAVYSSSALSSFSFLIPEEIFIPLPAALWLFVSGGLSLLGLARFKRRRYR